MRNYLFLFYLLALLSCSTKDESIIEMTFISKKNDTITELASFHLTNIDGSRIKGTKSQSFYDIKCDAPNKFVLKGVKPGLYFGLITVVNKSGTYNIGWDSLAIKPGKNYLTKEMNLGSISL